MMQAHSFACDYASCGQSFRSSTALASHQKKHSLSLRLTTDRNDESDNFSTPPAIPLIQEEMPTPCRFLKEFQRNSSFLDDIVGDSGKSCSTPYASSPVTAGIADNPFAETFRRASFSKHAGVSVHQLQVPDAETESLNTPSIQLHTSNENPLASLSRTSVSDDSGRVSPPLHLHNCKLPLNNETSLIKQTLNTADASSLPEKPQRLTRSSEPARQSDLPKKSNQIESNPVTAPSTISVTASSDHLPGVSRAADHPTSCLPKLPTTATGSLSQLDGKRMTSAKLVSRILPKPGLTSPQVVQLTVKMPDGNSIQLPVVPTSIPLPSLANSALEPRHVHRLPQPLPRHPRSSPQRTTPMYSDVSNTFGSSREVVSNEHKSPTAPLLKPGRKRKGQESLNAQEKRRQTLDRNREAAHRCRMRKRQWAQEKEDRADSLLHINNSLQLEIAKLRSEVLSLKTALLAHRDCSVTLQQLRLTVQVPENTI